MTSRRKTIPKPRPVNLAASGLGRDGDAASLRLVRQSGVSWRATLLGTAAAGALSFAIGGPALAAPNACTLSGGGTIATCSGNQSAGIASGVDFNAPPVTTLDVNNLTQAITPASATAGISFTSTGNVIINSNTGTYGISTTNSPGIFGHSSGGAVTVSSTGTIATMGNGGKGIIATTSALGGPVTVTSTGNITTTQGIAFTYGILAESYGNGAAVTVTSTGNITTQGNQSAGIAAKSAGSIVVGGAVTVNSTGNISTVGSSVLSTYQNASGIFALTNGASPVRVTSTGNITTTGTYASGIFAESYTASGATGAVMVTSNGNISAHGTGSSGIFAKSFSHGGGGGTGAVTVNSTGNITANTFGIYASDTLSPGAGAVTVTSVGNIASGSTGIFASAFGSATVTSTGNINSAADGIFASTTGTLVVTSTGNITAAGVGIYVIDASSIDVISTGNIVAGSGISATGFGAVTVRSMGNISTGGTGIYAQSGAATVMVTSTGNITAGIGIRANGAFGVTLISAGNITTPLGFGISAQSALGPITIAINSGTVSGGSGAAAGVSIVGGTTNTVTNFGTVTALSGLAIKGTSGNDTVNNFGTVTGNVTLGTGTNAFNNQAGGVFNAGATIDLGGGNLTNAGTLSPGGAGVIQTTALTGNLVQTAAGILLSDINIAGATSDRVNVSGTANLAGTVRVQVQNATLAPWQQTLLSATGGTTNNGLTLLASPALQAQLVFPNANDVAVKSAGINFVIPGLNGNQTALGNGLNGAAQTAALGGPVLNALLNGPTSLDGYRAVLNQLSGEGATGTQQATFDAMGQFVDLLLDPYSRGGTATPGSGVSGYAAEGDASAYTSDGRQRSGAERAAYAMFVKAPPAAFEARWNVWAAGFGGSQTTDGNAAVGSSSTTSRIAGGAVGADYRFAPDSIAGFALAGGGTNFVVANGLGNGRSDLFQAGAYFRHTAGPAYVAAALAYGWQDVTTNRTVTLAGLDQLQARFNANAFSGRLEGGYRFVSPWIGVGVTPYVAGQFTTFDLPSYREQAIIGTNNFALAFGAKSVTDPRTELGLRSDKSFAMPDSILTLRGRLTWAHDYITDRAIGATFQTLPGASFVVNGAAQSADKALTTAAAELKWRNGFSVSGTFEGEFGSNVASYAGRGVVRYQW